MDSSYVVVDGSNIATEGRSAPSLAQLDEAVRQFQAEFPEDEVIVVVDATFGHRIDPSERSAFDEAVAHAELVSPPAGAVGRGDAFLLRVAERVGGRVLSNDSFQEFHGEHPWLFQEGRLIGGKPVPGVGWIFTPRNPVRGARSRASVAAGPPKETRPTRGTGSARRPRSGEAARAAEAATVATIAEATAAAGDTSLAAAPRRSARSRRGVEEPEPVGSEAGSTSGRAVGAKATKADKAAKSAKSDKATKASKTAKADKAAKSDKAAKAAKADKATKADKAAKADKATKASKTAKAGTAASGETATRRRRAGSPAGGVARTTTPEVEPTGAPADEGEAAVPDGGGRRRRRRGRRATGPDVRAAIDVATVEAIAPSHDDGDDGDTDGGPSRRRRRTSEPPPAVNDPLTFLTFVSEHPVGSTVEGTVSSFVSHGAMVDVDGMLCYVPLAGLGTPPPRGAREVIERGERKEFVLVALDPPRRGAELALPDVHAARPPG